MGALTMICYASSAQAKISAPSDITNLVFWVDAADVNGNGAQPANGATITLWKDKSGQGHDLMAPSAVAPTFEQAGMGGVNPAIRLPLRKSMVGPNPFSGSLQNDSTIFFVHQNVTTTRNFVLSLNGSDKGNTRFSFHAPWLAQDVYFDPGQCCLADRLYAVYPNLYSETTLIVGQNSQSTSKKFLRVDGAVLASKNSAVSASVTGGIRIGSMPDLGEAFPNFYDGRIAEIIVYDRALSITEVEQVECYLLAKWKPTKDSSCVPSLSISKNSAFWAGNTAPSFDVPGNDRIYSVAVLKSPGNNVANGSVFLVEQVADRTCYFHGDPDGATGPLSDPVSFTDGGSGLSLSYSSHVRYSNSATPPTSFSACDYTPIAGYDPNVKYICVNPGGEFSGNNTSFTIHYRAELR